MLFPPKQNSLTKLVSNHQRGFFSYCGKFRNLPFLANPFDSQVYTIFQSESFDAVEIPKVRNYATAHCYRGLRSAQVGQKRKRKRYFPLRFVAYSLIFFDHSLIFSLLLSLSLSLRVNRLLLFNYD